jgi:hypothetical protein
MLVEAILGFALSTVIVATRSNKDRCTTHPSKSDNWYVLKSQRTRMIGFMREVYLKSSLYILLVYGMGMILNLMTHIMQHVAKIKVTRRWDGAIKSNICIAKTQAL